jgi:class 3 adenylate cyclase/putative methionine-R-sulfoxide reductase with GAF domain
MRRRFRAGDKRAKSRPKSAAVKHRTAPSVTRNRSASVAGRETVVAQLTQERDEALLRETANSEILRLISSSPGNLELVFRTILENATRICNAKFGNLFRFDGENYYPVAEFNTPAALLDAITRRGRFRPPPGITLDHVMRTKQVFHSADMAAEPVLALSTKFGGARSQVTVPMLKDEALIGAIVIYRQEVRPFTDKQVELVKNFAAQAVIAMENTRLLNELRQRTDDLTESLEQQTATSEVLRVISSSPGELEPVFQAMLKNATRICEAKFGTLYRFDGNAFYHAAGSGTPTQLLERQKRQGLFLPEPGTLMDRVLQARQVAHSADYASEKNLGLSAKYGGARSTVVVPMLKDNELIGAFAIYRQEVRPFTDKQIELLTNFAAQAVIAIENARLLKELHERTNQLEAESRQVVKLNEQLERRVADQVGEIERMGRLRRFLPPQVADLIVASGAEKQLESHRREITALFCDLRGFTGFSESSDPEDVMALLRDYHAAIGEIIIKYSGTLERYAGDGVMVVFNDPVPVDNPALQAVLMALEMRDAIGSLTEKWRRLGHDIGFGIGIAHGFATLGTIGFEGRFDYAAIGTVSNVASRLCDEAKPAQILISPRVLMAVEDSVTVENVGEFALKGIRRPLVAYNVLATKLAN